MTERINPLQPIEKILEKKPLSATASFKQVARKNAIEDVSVCVECGKQMRILECNGINCYVCIEHRVCLPVRDA